MITTPQGEPEAGATWRYEIQYGPEGEAEYAWVYAGSTMVGTFKTHHAIEVVDAMNRRAASPSPPPGVGEWQDILARGMPFGFDPATGFFHENDGGAPASCVFYEPLSAAPPVGVEVVKLEWTQDTNGNWLSSPLGITYLILEWDDLCDLEVSVGGDHYAKIGNFDNLAKAQDAGQDDFNRRLPTLVPSPLLKEAEEALRVATRLCETQAAMLKVIGLPDCNDSPLIKEFKAILARLGAAS